MNIQDYLPITSSDNTQIKLLKKLKLQKYRQDLGQFMIENLTIIVDALKAGHDFDALFVTEEFATKHLDKLEYLKSNSAAINFYLITPKLNREYSGLDAPSGVTAVYKIRSNELTKSSVIYLNSISDPGNLGTILRSALAFNFVNLVLDKNCVDLYNSKVINAAKDAIFKLNIIEDSAENWLESTKLPIYTTNAHSGLNLADFKPAKAFCLVLGSESHGISPRISELSQKGLKIEISPEIESLNVATAAAILFYELSRK